MLHDFVPSGAFDHVWGLKNETAHVLDSGSSKLDPLVSFAVVFSQLWLFLVQRRFFHRPRRQRTSRVIPYLT